MNRNSILAVALVLCAVALTVRSQTAPPKPVAAAAKIAVVAMNDAMMNTLDGKAAAAEMQAKFEPERTRLEKENAAIQALEDQLRKGAATVSDEARRKTGEEIA